MPSRYDEACASSRAVSVRRFIVHGTKDEDVSIDITRAFMWMRQNDPEPPSLLEIPDAGHMDLIDPKSLAGLIVIDLVTHLAEE
jgi:pimeloyl-ACP methyl ester carboxylesterase